MGVNLFHFSLPDIVDIDFECNQLLIRKYATRLTDRADRGYYLLRVCCQHAKRATNLSCICNVAVVMKKSIFLKALSFEADEFLSELKLIKPKQLISVFAFIRCKSELRKKRFVRKRCALNK